MATSTIACPLPGTFYRKPAPDQADFKQVGDVVAPGDTIGLVEVMKSFTAVKVEVAGTIVRFHVENEDEVMAGQPLLDIDL